MKNLFHKFIHDKSESMMLVRTVFEVGFGWIEMNLVQIIAMTNLDPQVQAMLVSLFTVLNTAVINWYRKVTQES